MNGVGHEESCHAPVGLRVPSFRRVFSPRHTTISGRVLGDHWVLPHRCGTRLRTVLRPVGLGVPGEPSVTFAEGECQRRLGLRDRQAAVARQVFHAVDALRMVSKAYAFDIITIETCVGNGCHTHYLKEKQK